VPVLIYRQSHWKEWECVVPLSWMIWMLECSNKLKARERKNYEKITMGFNSLTDIILIGKSHKHVSEGKMDILMEK